MLVCCNSRFRGIYCRVLENKQDFYRRVEYGICPNCGRYRFLDFRMVEGKVKIKTLSGREAENNFEKIMKRYKEMRHGAKSNQNYCYGDFKLSRKRDDEGNRIYVQLRRNFNNEAEVMGEVSTKITKI